MTLDQFILQEMKKRDMSMREFAKFVDVSSATISRTLDPTKKIIPSTEFLQKLAIATQTDIATIISMVFPELTNINTDIMLLAIRISQLPPEQQKTIKQLLLGMYLDNQ